ncbi:hypothetical protein CYLTODRAFT_361871 [Cylindrobasidium torrendii FP15055 ss-10]|uniref:Uncharacterized protein n=1 Tax=Cylindrobasidium torrendii FP15055 ss-10 TaxID=1314674 RepID=A0A0D7AY51_9AGAR|nr:hypothetical protein CYLTODRAFT_361871 [Cylindrobasidium torrendii FP15055 ss-10]
MDYDRKSTVSSFYGQKGSMDHLNHEARARGDDDASFYGGGGQQGGANSRAGYNRNSFFHTGREEPLKGGDEEAPEGGWDIYADFNNAGPRYSNFGGQQNHEYQPIAPSPRYDKFSDRQSPTSGNVELVTVPALGAEWQKDELRDMTKGGRREKKAEGRRAHWQQWRRNERGMCGHYFKFRFTVWLLFALCCAVGIILAFTIPRVPAWNINDNTPLANATGDWKDAIPAQFSRAPANFSFPAFANLQVYTGGNFLPLKFSHVYATVYDLNTDRQVGDGDLGSYTVPAKEYTQIQLPLNFSYVATNDSDTTWKNWYDACKNKASTTTGTRDGLKFRLELEMRINGLIGSRRTSTTVASANCPIELAINAA